MLAEETAERVQAGHRADLLRIKGMGEEYSHSCGRLASTQERTERAAEQPL